MQLMNFHFSMQINPVIVFGNEAVPGLLPVLAHDNEGGLDRSNCREDEVKQDVGIRVEWSRLMPGPIDRADNNFCRDSAQIIRQKVVNRHIKGSKLWTGS
jgi:hypothetical protein